MRRILFIPAIFWVCFTSAQTFIPEQFGSSVISFSSQFNTTTFSANQILGAPDRYPNCGGAQVWTPATADGGPEFIEVAFGTPQTVNTIRIYQTNNSGSVTSVLLREAGTNNWNSIYTSAAAATGCAKILEIVIPATAYNVDGVRINIDNNLAGEQDFDAVSIGNFAVMTYQWEQYPNTVIDKSTEYSSGSWSAAQALGTPNTYPGCGDIPTAWASAGADNRREFLVLGFAYPAKANRIRIYQTLAPGAIDTVSIREAGTDTWHQVYSATATATICPNILEINFTSTTYAVDAVRIAINSPAISNWNEIDAVALQSELPPGAKLSVQSGNWSDPATWSAGGVPSATDTIILGNGHVVTLDVNASIKSGILGSGSTLNIPSNTLTLGPAGGGREFLTVHGRMSITGGNLAMNGNIDFSNGSQLEMSSGTITVDGNDGTGGGSVPVGINMIQLDPGMSLCSVTGGMITVVDPQFNNAGQAISGNYVFGSGSTFRLGNGVSTQGGSNPKGFGGAGVYPQLGNLVIDAVTAAGNRQFAPDNTIVVAGNGTVTSGSLNPLWLFMVNGNFTNGDQVVNGSTFRTLGPLINNGNITLQGGSFSVGGDFLNNTGAILQSPATSNTSIGGNLVNNGTFNSSWLYMSNNFTTATLPQTIGGTGIFNIFGIDPMNNDPNGVTLLVPLTVHNLFFESSPGRLFIGNNDLTVLAYSYGNPGSDRYVVLNGTGRLINNAIGNSPVIFPVGTSASYTPLTIDNGSNHNFAVSVRSSFTAPPPTPPVNREWNITDLTGGAVNTTLTFQWNAGDEDPSFTRNLCYSAHYTTSWTEVSPGGPATGTGPYTRTVSNINSFSPFAILSGGTPLPVHLISFSAKRQNNGVKVNWKVDNESAMNAYEIERSSDGKQFSKIASVQALNQTLSHSYEVSDLQPLSGWSYYRLKQVNHNGSSSFSKIERVDFSHRYSVFIYPNPAKGTVTIEGIGQFRKAELIDAQGKIIMQWNITNNQVLDLSRIPAGSYSLRLTAQDETQTHKLIISK
jgi:hypothetical protein